MKTLVRSSSAVLSALVVGVAFTAVAPAPAAEPFWKAAGSAEGKVRLEWSGDAPPAVEAWTVTGKQEIVDDEILKRKVTAVVGKQPSSFRSVESFSGAYAVEALVRFTEPDPKAMTGTAALRVGVTTAGPKPIPAYSLSVLRRGERAHMVNPSVGEGNLWTQPLREGVPILENAPNRWLLNVAERFPLDKISPVWDEEFRVGIENDMLALPRERDRWRRLRIEVRSDRVRMYHDGLLAFDEPRGARTDGAVVLDLTGPASVAGIRVLPISELDSRYEPVVLDDLVNAGDFVDAGALPAGGTAVDVEGIPLVFPSAAHGSDHVDVGRSVFRYRRSSDPDAGDPNTNWPTIGQLDPARLRVRAPKGAYRRLWLVAAADGDPNNVPLVTVRFFKPRKGWAIDAATEVPAFTVSSNSGSTAGDSTNPVAAKRLPVKTVDGKDANLWLLSIDLDAAAQASELRNELVYHLELTKEVKGFRAFPDPMYYGFFQAGLPSAVRVYAMTLERAPVEFVAGGNRPGNTYPHPERPAWKVDVTNPHAAPQTARVKVDVTSPAGKTETFEETVSVNSGRSETVRFQPPTSEFGLFTVKTSVRVGDHEQTRSGTFVALPPDQRRATAKNSRWGLWYWNGAHNTHQNRAESMQLFKAYGSLIAGHAKLEDRTPWKLGPTPHLAFRGTPPWALQDPYDPAEYAKYSEECGQYVAAQLKKEPDLQYVSIFAEHSISLRVTHGTPPEAYGKPWYDYTPEEQKSIKAHFIAAKAAFEGVRKHAPQVKFLFGHCGPLFSLPFMRDGYPKEMFDGYGVDSPQFERMPERAPRAVETSFMYFLNTEMKRLGYDKELVHVESYYAPTHPMALSLRESADSIVRTAALSLANGTDRFLACWTLDDPEGAWGSQHYGSVGIIGRGPELNPKPGAAAYATMTEMLDTAKYDGWVPIGSHSAYCLRFKEVPPKNIYCLWTIRGRRPITVSAKTGGELVLVDENGNRRTLELKEGRATFELSSTPVWLVATKTAVDRAELGAPKYDEAPGEHVLALEDFERDGRWTFSEKPNERYAKNSWDMPREPAPFRAELERSTERWSHVLKVTCGAPTSAPNLTGRYGVLEPAEPIAIPGKGAAIGLRVRGNSGWGRVVYEIEDAKGEIFQSVGSKDQWNCDDTHSWSNFNFDGWRYLRFPLPANSAGDDYREADSVWWNQSAEGIVDLPVKLTRIIFEMPTHQLYVDQIVPTASQSIEIDDLTVEYASADDRTDRPVRVQQAAAGMLRVKSSAEGLPNPIAALRESGVGPATKIVRFYAPEQFNDGTRTHVAMTPVDGAKEYQVWVSAYPDGRGAMVLSKGTLAEPLVNRLRPGIPLYLFATYTDAEGKSSKPSEMATITLKDEFLQK
jgi:hypothetical protein